MAAAPKLLPYMVALLFDSGGMLTSNAVLAPSSEAAAAILAIDAVRQTGTPGNLIGVAVTPLHLDFLRAALRAAEGDLSGDGTNVLSLVPAAPPVRAECVAGSDGGPMPSPRPSPMPWPTDDPDPPVAA